MASNHHHHKRNKYIEKFIFRLDASTKEYSVGGKSKNSIYEANTKQISPLAAAGAKSMKNAIGMPEMFGFTWSAAKLFISVFAAWMCFCALIGVTEPQTFCH